MTVCIGALCDRAKAAVICADRELTVAALSLEFEHQESKIDLISSQTVVMSSGDALLAAEVIGKMPSLPSGSVPPIRQIAESLRDAYITVHLERAEQVILRPRGMTFEQFRKEGAQTLLAQVYINVDQQLFNFGIGAVDFLVVGVDGTGSHIFRVHYNGVVGGSWMEWCDKIGSRAIGSGSSHAAMLLSLEGQHRRMTIAETLFNVYSAKKSAELAPGVGRSTDLAVMTASGLVTIPESAIDALEELRAKTQKSKVDIKEVEAIYEVAIPKKQPKSGGRTSVQPAANARGSAPPD